FNLRVLCGSVVNKNFGGLRCTPPALQMPLTPPSPRRRGEGERTAGGVQAIENLVRRSQLRSLSPSLRGEGQGQGLNPALGESVEAEGGAEVGGLRDALGVERDSGRVGDAVDRIEKTDHRGRIDQCRVADAAAQGRTRPQ